MTAGVCLWSTVEPFSGRLVATASLYSAASDDGRMLLINDVAELTARAAALALALALAPALAMSEREREREKFICHKHNIHI